MKDFDPLISTNEFRNFVLDHKIQNNDDFIKIIYALLDNGMFFRCSEQVIKMHSEMLFNPRDMNEEDKVHTFYQMGKQMLKDLESTNKLKKVALSKRRKRFRDHLILATYFLPNIILMLTYASKTSISIIPVEALTFSLLMLQVFHALTREKNIEFFALVSMLNMYQFSRITFSSSYFNFENIGIVKYIEALTMFMPLLGYTYMAIKLYNNDFEYNLADSTVWPNDPSHAHVKKLTSTMLWHDRTRQRIEQKEEYKEGPDSTYHEAISAYFTS